MPKTKRFVWLIDGKTFQDQPQVTYGENLDLNWPDEDSLPMANAEKAIIWRRNGEERKATQQEKEEYYRRMGKALHTSSSLGAKK